jgi:phosphatidylserine decarboxylase
MATRTVTASPGMLAQVMAQIARDEDLNFLLTNRIPRRFVTQVVGALSRIESPLLTRALVALWQAADPSLDLSEAEPRRYRSLEECFTRRLRVGVRPIAADPNVIVSPCDAIVGALGDIDGTRCYQAKGFPYRLEDLLPDAAMIARHRGGRFVTLRLTSSMYHRFHAPCDGSITEVQYVAGDTWNVNPIALQRVESLFCRNERVVLDMTTRDATLALTLVPVAAILVASMVVHGLPTVLDLSYRGPTRLPCARTFAKGDELGYFRNGSTILLFATGDVGWCDGVVPGARIRMGEPLLRSPSVPLSSSPAAPNPEVPE